MARTKKKDTGTVSIAKVPFIRFYGERGSDDPSTDLLLEGITPEWVEARAIFKDGLSMTEAGRFSVTNDVIISMKGHYKWNRDTKSEDALLQASKFVPVIQVKAVNIIIVDEWIEQSKASYVMRMDREDVVEMLEEMFPTHIIVD